ncbi:MAG TPA: hypothetical protein VLB68_23550, partial [Pyrinomonadaceae bacterium]|nr:hypothetical protein [Pyrinomonadaceae bacterium]
FWFDWSKDDKQLALIRGVVSDQRGAPSFMIARSNVLSAVSGNASLGFKVSLLFNVYPFKVVLAFNPTADIVFSDSRTTDYEDNRYKAHTRWDFTTSVTQVRLACGPH